MSAVYIHATGDHYAPYDAANTDLKQDVTAAVGQPVRRIGRFIQLALIGAGRCAQAAPLAADTAVYFGSARGDLEISIEVMQTLFRDGHAPKPLSFINTVSNAACFYIAQTLKLNGRSSFVCNRYFAFESVLQLAMLDINSNAVAAALVGTVDAVVPPLEDHRIRLELPPETPVADASHWIGLRATPPHDKPLQLLAVENFSDSQALIAWLGSQPLDRCLLSGGQFLTETELQALATHCTASERFEYRDRAYYDSQSGAVIGEFVRNPACANRQLLHINRDPSGRYAVMWVGNPNISSS